MRRKTTHHTQVCLYNYYKQLQYTIKRVTHYADNTVVLWKVLDNFVPPLLDAVLLDYQRNVPVAREPEVLSTMEVIVNKLEVRRAQSNAFTCFLASVCCH